MASLVREIASDSDELVSLRIVALETVAARGEYVGKSIREIFKEAEEPVLKQKAIEVLNHTDAPLEISLLEDIVLDEKEYTEIRIHAIRSLLRLTPSAALSVLREWLADPETEDSFRGLAAIELARRNERASFEAFEDLLRETASDRFRFALARALTILGDTSGIGILRELIQSPSSVQQVRRDAIEVFATLGDRSFISFVQKTLGDEAFDPELRSTAVDGLGHFEIADVSEILVKIFNDVDYSYGTRRAASRALLRLSVRLDTSSFFEQVRNPTTATWIRRDIAMMFGQVGDESVVPVLREILEDCENSPWLRRTAADALWQISQHYRVWLEPLS